MMRHLSGFSATLLFLALATAPCAETLLLKNGQVIEDIEITKRYPDGTIDFVMSNGLSSTFMADRYTLITDKDLLVLKNGSYYEGSLVGQDDTTIRFRTNEGVRSFPVGEVSQVVGSGGDVHRPGAIQFEAGSERDFERVEDFIADGLLVEAMTNLELLSEAKTGQEARIAVLIAEMKRSYNAEYNKLMEERRETEAADLAQMLLEGLSEATFTPVFQSQETQREHLATYVREEASARLKYAERILEDEQASDYPEAIENLERSVMLEPTLEGYLAAAELLARDDRFEAARSALLQAQLGMETPGIVVTSEHRRRFNRVHGVYLREGRKMGRRVEPVIQEPEATPEPTPEKTPNVRIVAPVAPTPTPTPPPPPPKTGMAKYIDDYIKQPYEKADEFTMTTVGLPAWQAALALIGGFILLWPLPIFINGKLADKGMYAAERYKGLVNKIGLFGLCYVGVSSLFGGKSSGGGEESTGKPGDSSSAFQRKKEKSSIFGRRSKSKDGVDVDVSRNIDGMNDKELLTHIEKLCEHLALAKISISSSGGTLNDAERDTIQNLVIGLVTLSVLRNASDIHIEPELEGAKVRMRFDGVLTDVLNVPRAIMNALISALKVMADLDIAEKRRTQDGKISMRIQDSDVDLRINTAPGIFAERVTLRILDSRSIQIDSAGLGLEGENLKTWRRVIHRPSGVVFLTGPTGAGKTTTLCVALNELNNGERNIITIENPIEYYIKGINQMQVNEAAGFTFASGLRSILRSDPDVIMVGEIRDKETADTAIDAANTGHLVFTTLHTIDATTVMPRLLDLGVEPRRAANAILASIAQRLCRINCPQCRAEYTPSDDDLEQLGMRDAEIEKTKFMKGEGCEDMCRGSGFHGRTGLFEIFEPNEVTREMMEQGKSVNSLREAARRHGMRTLREEGILRIRQGLTSVEEVLRTT